MTSSLDLSINASMLSMLLRILRINEAVVQYVVDDVGQTVNGRAAHIFDALSTMQSLQAHDAITEPKSRERHPTHLFIRLPTRQRRIVTLGKLPLAVSLRQRNKLWGKRTESAVAVSP